MDRQTSAFETGGDLAFRPGFVRWPLVSVIVTNYNYERYIEDCLRSIAEQTYDRIECLVVDDASTDGSVERIREVISRAEGAGDFRLVALEANGGQMNAFIEGFRRSTGEFVVFVDADDYLFPDFVETHVAAHLNPCFAAGLTCSNEVLVDGENRLIAGSIEKWHRAAKADHRLAPGVPVRATQVPEWRQTWRAGHEGLAMDRPTEPLLYVAPDANLNRIWLWSTTSAVMFRRGVLDVTLKDSARPIRICADYYLLQFGHLLGGSLIIQTAHGCYRRHGANNFSLGATIGRAALRGSAAEDASPEALDGRIVDELIRNYDELVRLMGEARMMQIFGGIVPFGRLRPSLACLGKGRPLAKTQFMVLYGARQMRRGFQHFLRMLRFI